MGLWKVLRIAMSVLPREEAHEPADRARRLGLVHRAGGIHGLGTHLGAVAHRRAGPHALLRARELHALRPGAVARVVVVAQQERGRPGPQELAVEAVLRARRVAQQAVDAVAEGFEARELRGALAVFTL